MNALVTGGAGFIGSHVAEALVRAGTSRVRVLDNLSRGSRDNLAAICERIEFIEGDLLDARARTEALRGVEVVFHLAAIPSVPESVADPVASHRHGTEALFLLLEDARKSGARRVVFASSSAVYGDRDTAEPASEALAPSPVSPYAATKAAGEQYCRAYARSYGLDTVSLRYFNVFGPRQDPRSPYSGAIARFCTALRDGSGVDIFGDGLQTRDFIYVEDVARANLAAAQAAQPLRGEAVNIATGRSVTLLELLESLQQAAGRRAAPRHGPPRAGDVRHSTAAVEKARALLGFSAEASLGAGLAKTWAWYLAQSGRP